MAPPLEFDPGKRTLVNGATALMEMVLRDSKTFHGRERCRNDVPEQLPKQLLTTQEAGTSVGALHPGP